MTISESSYHLDFSKRILQATETLFADQPVTRRIQNACADFDRQCTSIIEARGIPVLTISVVGAKGQGKSWIARQFILNTTLGRRLPSGVLGSEATTKLYWVGPNPPELVDGDREVYLHCEREQMLEIGFPYLLLDTPGVTDSDLSAVESTRRVLHLSPIKLLVLRRDQLRAAINSQLAGWVEGAVCIPVVTCVPLKELGQDPSGRGWEHDQHRVLEKSLEDDLRKFSDWLRASAPQSQLESPILIEDFEASGQEEKAGQSFARELQNRLHKLPLQDLTQTRTHRLNAIHTKFRREVVRILEAEVPYLSSALRKLHEEADRLPTQVVEDVLGSPMLLNTAVRGRLRAQFVSDTSHLWFPYRSILVLLSFTQGAWDRLVMALTGSIPSIFGTMTAWARNLQQSRKVTQEMEEGIRDRMARQVDDRLQPIHRQFHNALRRLRGDTESTKGPEIVGIKLGGIDELQSQSRRLFEKRVDERAVASFWLQMAGMLASLLFWALLAGPIVSVYRQYLSASAEALSTAGTGIDHFPHPLRHCCSQVFCSQRSPYSFSPWLR